MQIDAFLQLPPKGSIPSFFGQRSTIYLDATANGYVKAAFFDGKNLKLDTNYPKPQDLSLVKVDLAGICGTDLEILDGYMQYTGVLGHEFVGTVVSSQNSEIVGKRVVGEINAACGKCHFCIFIFKFLDGYQLI